MTDVFVSYARSNKDRVRLVTRNMESDGRDVWWDEKLRSGEDFGAKIEDAIEQADRVLVAWSKAARRSVWVRGEALKALDTCKLVQIQLDGSQLPIPFNALHAIDFVEWYGERDSAPWRALNQALDAPEQERDANLSRVYSRLAAWPSISSPPLSLTTKVIGGDLMSTAIAVVAPILSAVAVLSARFDMLNARSFTALVALAFAASTLASVLSIARLLRTDTSTPRT